MKIADMALIVAMIVAVALLLSGVHRGPEQTKLTQSLATARAAWPQSPCKGREIVYLGNKGTAMVDKQIPSRPNVTVVGLSDPPTCQVWIRKGLPLKLFCVTLTHEFGHLAGRVHNHIPGDLMNGDGKMAYRPCTVLAKKLAH